MRLLTSFRRMPLMLRLLLNFLATSCVLIVLLVTGVQMIADENKNNWRGFENIFADYGHYLSNRIGDPSNYEAAQTLANDLMLNISIIGPNENWHSLPKTHKHDMDRLIELKYDESATHNASVARTRGNYYVRILTGEGQEKRAIYISKRREFVDFQFPFAALLVFLLIPLSLYVSYRLTKSLFAPIKTLQAASLEYAKGNLTHQVEIKRDDELGSLTQVMNSMAQQIDKMLQAKRQMLLAISHELRTPLTRMKLATELLEHESQQKPLRRDILEMENLINEILESERLNSQHKVLNLESIKLDELLSELVFELNLNFDERVELEAQTIENMMLDPARIRLLFRNLIMNALQHSKSSVRVFLTHDKDKVQIKVQDQGAGIETEHIPHLTQAFYRIDDARQRKTGGFGLGLYLCQLIVEAHKGSLDIESQLGRGTQVNIALTSMDKRNEP